MSNRNPEGILSIFIRMTQQGTCICQWIKTTFTFKRLDCPWKYDWNLPLKRFSHKTVDNIIFKFSQIIKHSQNPNRHKERSQRKTKRYLHTEQSIYLPTLIKILSTWICINAEWIISWKPYPERLVKNLS